MAKKKKSLLKKILLWLLVILILAGGSVAYITYRAIYLPNVTTGDKKSEIILIPTGSNFEDVIRILSDAAVLKNKESFIRLAKLKKYKEHIRPGRYRRLTNINNNELVNLLRAGIQEPVPVTFNNIRKKEQLVSIVCKKLETDSAELNALLNNDKYLKDNFGVKSQNVLTIFIPNTYDFKWNTSAKQFINRMEYEYKRFWNSERKAKAKKLGLTQTQVSVLASIVQAEQLQFPDERPIIEGVDRNRQSIGLHCQTSDHRRMVLREDTQIAVGPMA